MRLTIAELVLHLEDSDYQQFITIPICHKEFIQPAVKLQAEFLGQPKIPVIRSTGSLHLELRCAKIPPHQVSDTPLLRSNSWELWQDKVGNLVFKHLTASAPSQITVTPDFTRGEVLVDLSAFSGKTFYPLINLESRLFSAWLASTGDMIMHASGVSVNGEGYCFLGDSGAGKSTLAGILAQRPGVTVLGEDQVILRYLASRFWIFGTPWHQNLHMCSPLGVPLSKMFFLDRSLPPGTIRLEPVDGVTRLLQIAIIPYHLPQWLPGILDRLSLLANQVPFISLSHQLGTDPWFSIDNA